MKVVIAEPLTAGLADLIKANKKDWTVYEQMAASKQDFINRIRDAEVVASYYTKIDREVFENCPKLQYIAVAAVGVDSSVDVDEAKKRDIVIMNCPGYNSVAVAEMAVGLAIGASRSIGAAYSAMRQGKWDNESHLDLSRLNLAGKRVGLIGYGNIGKTIQRLLSTWTSDFVTVASISTSEQIDSLMQQSDIIFICCPLNAQTHNLVSAKRIAMMKKTALLINISRGAVVDEDALYLALKNREIGGAGLDVFIDEPARASELPENIKRFARLNNAICTPHIAGSSRESSAELAQMLFSNIQSAIDRKPINIYQQK